MKKLTLSSKILIFSLCFFAFTLIISFVGIKMYNNKYAPAFGIEAEIVKQDNDYFIRIPMFISANNGVEKTPKWLQENTEIANQTDFSKYKDLYSNNGTYIDFSYHIDENKQTVIDVVGVGVDNSGKETEINDSYTFNFKYNF